MNYRSLGLTGLVSILIYGCSGGGGGNSGSVTNTTSGPMELIEVSTGNGLVLPLQIFPPDASGFADTTQAPVSITSREILTANLTATNPVLAPVQWSSQAVLSTQLPGNHFALVRFNQEIDPQSVLSDLAINNAANNLTDAIQVLGIDPVSGQETVIAGRGFVGGQTFGRIDATSGKRLLETWVVEQGLGIADTPFVGINQPGAGFPGSQSVLPGIGNLLSPTAFVFVADSDNDMETLETFPSGLQIHVRFTKEVLNNRGRNLSTPGIAASRVSPTLNPSPDTEPLAVLLETDLTTPFSVPRNGDVGVDPGVVIELAFTKSVQITTLGPYDDGTPPGLGSAVMIQYGTVFNPVTVPYSVAPRSVYDFTHMQLRPVVPFVPGNPNNTDMCSNFSDISVSVVSGANGGATGLGPAAAAIVKPETIFFSVGEGPALVNNPVLPDAIYVGRTGALSVIDLNGFGQGPGNPTYDPAEPIKEGNSNFPNNKNFLINGSFLTPTLFSGQCTVDGGSEGVFTLAKNSALSTELIGSPVLENVSDMALGHSLDSTFNNGSLFGCQSGPGANTCASTSGLKTVTIMQGANNTLIPWDGIQAISLRAGTSGNIVSWAPHPNPPPLIFPPVCFAPLIGAAEPTTGTSGANLMVPGALPQGDPAAGLIPDGILAKQQNAFFLGPSLPNANIAFCAPYSIRQQIGQFMYVIDRQRREVVVLNSNRFTVIDRITMPDPTSFAMSPDLDYLAVSNQSSNQVIFLDTSPVSPTFHEVVATTNVGVGPTGIAWSPGNEDILVCNTTDSSMSILSAFSFAVRKTISSQLSSPLDVAITARQTTFGLQRGVYFAYIINADGSVAVFESGPDGLAGIGFDTTIQSLPFVFQNPKAIQVDASTLSSQVWVVHENQLTPGTGIPTGLLGGAASLLRISNGALGVQALTTNAFGNANARDLEWEIVASIGSDQLTGIPVDIAFDNLISRTASLNFKTPFSSRESLIGNGKSVARQVMAFTTLPANDYSYIFFAIPNSSSAADGAIDVIDRAGNIRVDTNVFQPGTQSIPASGVNVLADYFRQ